MFSTLLLCVRIFKFIVYSQFYREYWHSKCVTLRTHSMQAIGTFDTLFSLLLCTPANMYHLEIASKERPTQKGILCPLHVTNSIREVVLNNHLIIHSRVLHNWLMSYQLEFMIKKTYSFITLSLGVPFAIQILMTMATSEILPISSPRLKNLRTLGVGLRWGSESFSNDHKSNWSNGEQRVTKC